MTHLRLRMLLRADPGLRYKALACLLAVLGGGAWLLIPHASGRFVAEALGPDLSLPATTPLAGASITPITNVSAGSSGITFSGDAYDVSCTTDAAASVLYPAMHDGTAWTIYTAYPCTNTGSPTKITCVFPAKRGSGLTWNAYKEGAATLSSCTAEQRYNGAPFPTPPAQSSGGTVTSITCGTGLSGGTITSTGTCSLSTVAATLGGTGQTTVTTGDLLYGSAANTWSKLAAGTSGYVLTAAGAGVAPAWAAAGGAVRKEIPISWSGGFGITSSQTDQYGIPPYTAGTGFTNDYPYVMLRAGSITGISIMLNRSGAGVSGGSLTAKLFKNGSAVASCEAAITSGLDARATFTAGTYTYSAADRLEIRWTTTMAYVGPAGGSFSIEVTES